MKFVFYLIKFFAKSFIIQQNRQNQKTRDKMSKFHRLVDDKNERATSKFLFEKTVSGNYIWIIK